MGQKSHPISLRLESTNRNWDHNWFSGYSYTTLLIKDIFFQQYFNRFLKVLNLPKSRCSLRHLPKKTLFYLFLCYPKSSRDLQSKFFGIVSKSKMHYVQQAPFSTTGKGNLKKMVVQKENARNKFFPKLRLVSSLFQRIKNQELYKKQGFIPALQEKKLMYKLFLKPQKQQKFLDQLQLQNSTAFAKTAKGNFCKTSGLHSFKKGSFLKQNHLFFGKNPLKPLDSLIYPLMLYNLKKQQVQKATNNNVIHQPLQKTILVGHSMQKYVQKSIFANAKPLSTFFQEKISFIKYLLFLYNYKQRNGTLFEKTQTVQKDFKFYSLGGSPYLSFQLEKEWNHSTAKIRAKIDFCKSKTLFRKESLQNTSLGNQRPDKGGSIQTHKVFSKNMFLKRKISCVYSPHFFTLDSKYRTYFEHYFSSIFRIDMELVPFQIQNEWQNAGYLADEIVYFLEKRIPFRRIKTTLFKQLSSIETIQGVRIVCSGRVGGKSKKAQRAKIESMKYGQTCLQVFSSQIDFAARTASTPFGSVGVKVWICYN